MVTCRPLEEERKGSPHFFEEERKGMVGVVCTVLARVCFGDDLDNVLAVFTRWVVCTVLAGVCFWRRFR